MPVDVDLWDSAHVGAYLKVSQRTVAERIAAVPGFPKAVRVPTKGGGRGHPLWPASEVIEWANSGMVDLCEECKVILIEVYTED